MKFSELWLREWVNIPLDKEELSKQITMAGLEVDGFESVSREFYGVVIGEIINCEPHPGDSRLQLTKVNIDGERLLNIVCDAVNCRQGIKVAVAAVGATILARNCEIEVIEILGELSEGILCSYSDLGISNDCSICELPPDAPIGTDIRNYLKLDDYVIKINITPNRADCFSMLGIARDVALLNKIKLNEPDVIPVIATISDALPIHIKAVEACPRYLSRIIKGINVHAPSPMWIKERLRRHGIHSINAVVDVANYVLLELGQPMHVFDKDRIEGGIVVRMAKDNETLILIDSTEVKLDVDTLVIADYKKVLAIGGILGGRYSSIHDKTKDVLLECAFFSPTFITGRARRYGLRTNASHRYEHGVDPNLQHKAIERGTRLILDICGGEAGPVINITNKVTLPKCAEVTLYRNKLDRLIGCHIDHEQVNDILFRLGCNIIIKNYDYWTVTVPSWRFDINIEEDLIEEVARVYGYSNIPEEPIRTNLVMHSYRKPVVSLKRVKMLLNDKGYQEVITYSFVDPKVQKLIHPDQEPLILPSPISREMSSMRLSLLTGLLSTIVYNQKHQASRVRIFETGLCFVPDIQASLGVRQDLMLAGSICGNRYKEHWDLKKSDVDFYDVKGDLESIFSLTGKHFDIKFRAEAIPAMHPGQSAIIYLNNERIGFIGVVHPEIEKKIDLKSRTIVFELDWNKIAAHHVVPRIQDISRFPSNRRDISIIVNENVPAEDILTECKKINENQLVDVNLFDVYRGNGISEGFKSLAISLILQDNHRTLQEKEITATVQKCVETLKERFQASLRD